MRYTWIESHRDQYSVSRLCRLLEVSRTGYLQWRGRPCSDRSLACRALDVQVAAIHAASKRSYGRPRIVRDLRNQGLLIGHERVRRSLQRQGLRPVYKRPYRVTTDSDHRKAVSPNLLDRRFDCWQINQAWVCDITYVGTAEGWLYLATVMDLGSRRIVGWSMSERMKADLVCEALKSAYWRRKPLPGLLVHSDRGSQYASDPYRQLISDFAMLQSMSRKANCWDNSPMESFYKSLKVERVYQVAYETRNEARLDIVNWIEGFYNGQRLHSSVGYRSPTSVEADMKAA